MRLRRFAWRAALLALLFLALDQVLDRVVLRDGLFLGRPVAPFDPPLFSPSQVATLARIESELGAPVENGTGKFDAELGWCNPPASGFGDFRYDWAGARLAEAPLAREKRPGVRRVVAVGCSMTHGEEVGPKETWCARTAALRDGLEIANLGVAAYGIDQALLRLRRDGWKLEPDEVWLGVLPRAALRVTTLFRPLLDHWSLDIAFKPRFVLDAQGELGLVPNPVASLADIPRLLHDQRAFLEAVAGNDPWVARAPRAYAPRGSSWAHGSFAARIALTLWERSGRDLEACFDEQREFGQLFTAIVRTTARESAAHGALFRLLVLPSADDLRDRTRAGRGYWEDWAERLRAAGVQVFDCSAALLGSGLALETLFAPQGHYTPAGSEVVARALVAELAR